MGAFTKILFGKNLRCRNCRQSSGINSEWWEKCGRYRGYIIMRCKKCDHGILLGAFAEKPFKPELYGELGIDLSGQKGIQAEPEKEEELIEKPGNDKEREVKEEFAGNRIDPPDSGQWECPVCKRIHDKSDKTCWSCGGKKEDLLGRPVSKPKKTLKRTGEWQCRVCKRTHEESDQICWSCGGNRENVEGP